MRRIPWSERALTILGYIKRKESFEKSTLIGHSEEKREKASNIFNELD